MEGEAAFGVPFAEAGFLAQDIGGDIVEVGEEVGLIHGANFGQYMVYSGLERMARQVVLKARHRQVWASLGVGPLSRLKQLAHMCCGSGLGGRPR